MQPTSLRSLAWASRAICGVLFLVSVALSARPHILGDASWGEVTLNTLLLSIPLAYVFLALGLLVEVVGQEAFTHRLTRRAQGLLRWLPRVGAIVFAVFVSLFALDVFGEGYGFWETLTALFMHLLPTLGMLLVLALTWRWPAAGAVGFLALAALFVLQFGAGWGSDWLLYLTLVGPLVMTGLLFLASWWRRGDLRANGASPAY